ncbi:MAG: hypothetical protein L6R41_002842 [Letrouitia leprolyta]|nr:MAG: hypothetical protein L6R41_002842 [Letrouitia leprolyta]
MSHTRAITQFSTSIIPTSFLVFILLLLYPPFLHASDDRKPECENQVLPLPPVSSCSHLINTIYQRSLKEPFLYHWSRIPSSEPYTETLPRTFIDSPPPAEFTYICALTVDVFTGHEKDRGDSFGYLDIVRAANEILKQCLKRERGIRPQVGWMGIGFLEIPQVIGVSLGSLRRMEGGTWWDGRRVVDIVEGGGNGTGIVEVA